MYWSMMREVGEWYTTGNETIYCSTKLNIAVRNLFHVFFGRSTVSMARKAHFYRYLYIINGEIEFSVIND